MVEPMKSFAKLICEDRAAIRARKPLVHSMTNFVVMNETANALLAIGASPVMTDAVEEVEEMVSIASALVLNIGTLYPRSVDAMVVAGRVANRKGIPVVLDPVGAGATRLRTDAARRILSEVRVSVLRANQGEAMAVAGMQGDVRGVDSVSAVEGFADIGRQIAIKLGCPVAVTGATDVITDGTTTYLCHNGHSMLQDVTGTGCTVTALTGAFLAVSPDVLRGAAGALGMFGLCGELAAAGAAGPATFEIALRDLIYSISDDAIMAGAKVEPA
jgi:hydroxyethylthiazole kinase